jgi:hypothetical protein
MWKVPGNARNAYNYVLLCVDMYTKYFVLTIIAVLLLGVLAIKPVQVQAQLPSQCSIAMMTRMIEPSDQCSSIGYQDGLANPGTSCPGGMNGSFCSGWNMAQEHSNNGNPSPPSSNGPAVMPHGPFFNPSQPSGAPPIIAP